MKSLQSARVPRFTFCQRIVSQRLIYFNYGSERVDHDNDHELDRILEKTLECTNLDEYTSLSTYQWSIGHGDSSHEHMAVGMSRTNFGTGTP